MSAFDTFASSLESFSSCSWQSVLGTIAQTKAGAVAGEITGKEYLIFFVILAVMILPFVIGNFLAKNMKMQKSGTRFGWVLLAIAASTAVLCSKWPGLGVDLSGGTILVYEMDPVKLKQAMEEGGDVIKSQDLIEPLTRRINPAGTQEIVLRPYGDTQLEIIVPAVEQAEVDRIKTSISKGGVLRFAIVANRADHQPIISAATEQAQATKTSEVLSDFVRLDDNREEPYGWWVEVDRAIQDGVKGEFKVGVAEGILRNESDGQIISVPGNVFEPAAMASWADQQGYGNIQVLMVVDPKLDVTGEDLAFAAATFDENGAPSVAFNMKTNGARRFGALTQANIPQGNRKNRLGIVLDDALLSAPTINSQISKQGRITGNFTQQEVEDLVRILKAGQLPAALTKEPIAENQIDPTLGQDTINKGVWAIGISMVLVLVFILFYYRFPGMIACVALILNLAMILAMMVCINQPLTLPGLAGLVLTVGMSVDANVLIFERIREELKKGAASRMAIRNGFAKATVTIIDANLTTLITAIVLYAIGTDQIRGFAVTLILGILFSMFTAIYVSRTLFDLAERQGFLSLSMSDGVNAIRQGIAGESGLDFIGKGRVMLGVSAILVTIGVVSLVARGSSILDIDFAGGSSVQFRLASPASSDQIRDIIKPVMVAGGKETPYTVNGVTMEGVDDETVYKVDSSLSTVEELKNAIIAAFDGSSSELITYDVKVGSSPASGDTSMQQQADTAVRLVSAQVDDADDSGSSQEAQASEEEQPAVVNIESTVSTIELGVDGGNEGGRMKAATLRDRLLEIAQEIELPLADSAIELTPVADDLTDWSEESSLTFSKWEIKLSLSQTETDQLLNRFAQQLDSEPVWISSSSVGASVAGDMIGRAFGALFASLLCIIGYIWFRFQRVIYGFAAVAALLHDVLITLGAIAISYWLAGVLGVLLIDPFKISLTVVAALLTIIGYSLNDTIVVFDRIRETKGKAAKLTGEMINNSINQTLSRTLLTSITTLIVVVLLYTFGGDGIHAFAFALVVGVLVGTYSSIFVASPILLYLVGRSDAAKAKTA